MEIISKTTDKNINYEDMNYEDMNYEENKHYLFCYGSNNIEQLKERLNIIRDFSIFDAYLDNHVRIFAGISKRWKGGIVGIYPCKNMKVKGILVELNKSELEKLDFYENGYERIELTIHKEMDNITTELVKSEVYWKTNLEFSYLPSNNYLESIYKMLHNRQSLNKDNIIIRGIVNGELKKIGIWEMNKGIKLKL